jgi:cellulose synthase/poly-beta-1,6-N-acetylglucosamine synthase-like glycosyltransferase
MTWLELCFWLPLLGILYVFIGYPLCMAMAAKLFGRGIQLSGSRPQSVSIIMAVHDEESHIVRRLKELVEQLATIEMPGELFVVSDGSTDNTVALAQAQANAITHVLVLEENEGKAVALNAGYEAATGEVLVFADARQSWAPDALRQLLESFRDPSVGAVSGNLLLEEQPGALTGVGAYWRYEKWLRLCESRLHSLIGVTGAISACRRALFKPIPKGTLLDDVYWPLQVAMQRGRVVQEPNAIAYDRLPLSPVGEFQRKVRTLCGVIQIFAVCPKAWLPWRNPIWFQLLSHKLLRLFVPWALLFMLAASIALPGPLYRIALWSQLSLYVLGLLGLQTDARPRLAITRTAASFLLLHSAAWLAFWVWLLGNPGRAWRKTPFPAQSLQYSRSPS